MIHSDADRAMQSLSKYDQAEVYVSKCVVKTVYIDDSRISNIETKTDSGMMARMIEGGRSGKASVSLNRGDAIPSCIGMAEAVLRHSPEDGERHRFPEPQDPLIQAPDVWDTDVVRATPDDLRELAGRLIDSCDVKIPRALIRLSTNECCTMNSNGVDVFHSSTLVYGHFTSMAVIDHPGEGTETFHGTHLNIDFESIGRRLSEKARSAASCREFRGSRKLSMILPPSQLGDMMMSSVGAAVNGENVKYGRSLWKDSVGGMVASPELTIVDDPTASAPLSCRYDDEGTPVMKRRIVVGGELKSFIRDSFCGNSTGNAFRRSSVEAQGAYERTPVIKPVNFTVEPGNLSPDRIVAETDDGILVDQFAWPEADALTGRFGLNVRCGRIVRNGEVVDTVNNALLMGNMLDAVRSIEMIGDDPQMTGVMTVPTMSFSGAELVGNRGL